MKYEVTGKVKIFNMPSPWIYIDIPNDKLPKMKTKGWGSYPVRVTLGKTIWDTSLFPLKKDTYFVAIKKKVREKEDVCVGDIIILSYVSR